MKTILTVMVAAAAFAGGASAADSTAGVTRVVAVDHAASMDTPVGNARFRVTHAQALHSHPVASYRLYRHYLDRGLDRDAVRYEALAVRQGYVIPPRLDPRRG
jgi:hypothetical protein